VVSRGVERGCAFLFFASGRLFSYVPMISLVESMGVGKFPFVVIVVRFRYIGIGVFALCKCNKHS
jgi:hypothetical protein